MKTKILLTLFIVLYFGQGLKAQDKCSRNVVNCKGECGRFVDKNEDDFCDLSERTENIKQNNEEKTNTSVQKEEIKQKNIQKDIKGKDIDNDEDSLDAEDNNDSTEELVEAKVDEIIDKSSERISVKKKKSKPYRLIGISSLTLFLYFLSFLMVKLKRMRKITHRKIWNFILLITFLLSCILGFVLVVQLNYNILQSIYLTNLKLHVEFGLSMTIIAIIHILWHFPYFKKIFQIKQHKNTINE